MADLWMVPRGQSPEGLALNESGGLHICDQCPCGCSSFAKTYAANFFGGTALCAISNPPHCRSPGGITYFDTDFVPVALTPSGNLKYPVCCWVGTFVGGSFNGKLCCITVRLAAFVTDAKITYGTVYTWEFGCESGANSWDSNVPLATPVGAYASGTSVS